jgi:hypothetical protein
MVEYIPSDEMILFIQMIIMLCKYLGLEIKNYTNEKYHVNLGNYMTELSDDEIKLLQIDNADINFSQ